MAQRPDTTARKLARFVKEAAIRKGFAVGSSSGDGKAKLAAASGMSEADISKILAGEYEVPTDLLKPLATAIGEKQKDLLRAAGVLEDKPAQQSPPLAAHHLGIKSPKNVEAFETIVAALLQAEKRR
ncbi:hypothetical protein [Streptomyces europaeiscabiei]|uniref:hypothetical protein n=1 Tax=Streptomyces europaeiscabiei TaxID=146819 RepID=UPI002E0FFCFB|nr:hypothetical protein OHB30_43125 [Streptomyces europaeiscabiei]